MKIESGNSSRRCILRFALACAGATAIASAALPAQAEDASHGGRLEGVWRVTRHAINCRTGAEIAVFPALMNFDAGGAMGGYDVPPGTTPAFRSPAYGVWQHEEGRGNFSFRQVGYTYDAAGAYSGQAVVTGQLALDHAGDSFTYTSNVTFYDAAGNILRTGCGTATGARF